MRNETPPRPRRARRTTADRLRAAILDLTGGHAQILAHSERPWASITFAGARHRLTLEFTGTKAVAVGEAFIADLPEHEFTLPGQLVADATVAAVDHALMPAPHLTVTAELLLIEDA